MAATFWPGVAMYDTVAQYGQVLSGDVDDWHPPIMVRLWQLLHPLGPTTGPMFLLQVALYASGFALIVAALVRAGRWRAAIGAVVLAMSPLLLGWQMVVLKDAQMLGALVAAFGIVSHYRLAERRIAPPAAAVVALLLVYATLVRANAVFATVPFAVLILPRPRAMVARVCLTIAITGLVIGVSPLINDHLLGASPSGVAKSQPLFDLAAIAVATPNAPSPFTQEERRQIAKRHCVKAFFWDPLGEPTACGPAADRLTAQPASKLYADLARAVVTHPIAYAEHRLRHWNSTERWLVASNLPDAAPPIEAEPNAIGLATPASPFAASWQDRAASEAATPFGWPIVWTFVALALAPRAWRRREAAAGQLALALVASALLLEASFLVISIASDLRYHLWSMTASALALILLSDSGRASRREWIAAAGLSAIAAAGVIARDTQPPAPDTYQGMIHAPSG